MAGFLPPAGGIGQRVFGGRRPVSSNEAYWRAKLANQGKIQAEDQPLVQKLQGKAAKGLQAAGLNKHDANRLASKTLRALNDLTPVGNATMASDGAQQARRGYQRGSVWDALAGSGQVALAALPGAVSRPAKAAGRGLFGRGAKVLRFDDLPTGVQEDIAHHVGQLANDDPQWIRQTFSGLEDPIAVPQMSLSLSEIVSNKATSPFAVEQYARMQTKAPPVMVERRGDQWHLLEGGHRFGAAQQRGDKQIDAMDVTAFRDANWADFFDGQTDETMPLWSNARR